MTRGDLPALARACEAEPGDRVAILVLADAMDEAFTLCGLCHRGRRFDSAYCDREGVLTKTHQACGNCRGASDFAREAAVLRVLAEPESDDRRLAFADWCERNGERERARLIRVQREPCQCLRSGYLPLCERCEVERILWSTPVRTIPGGLAVPGEVPNAMPHYSGGVPQEINVGLDGRMKLFVTRGFVSRGRGPLAALLAHLPAILAENPVEAVEVTDREPSQYSGGGRGHSWYWCESRGDTMFLPDRVPPAVAVRLTGHVRESDGVYEFASPDLARAALSTALLAVSRRRAWADRVRRLDAACGDGRIRA